MIITIIIILCLSLGKLIIADIIVHGCEYIDTPRVRRRNYNKKDDIETFCRKLYTILGAIVAMSIIFYFIGR